MNLHAGLVALRRQGVWRGALIVGPSGSGKSDLMLRALDLGLTLAADDRTIVWTSGGALYGRAPAVLGGRIEARGLDVLSARWVAFSRVAVVVRCEDPEVEIERVWGGATAAIAGVRLPLLRLRALEASAPAKLRRALERLGGAAAAP